MLSKRSPAALIETVESYRFMPDDLRPSARLPGISAFMRIKNGAEFLEASIRSHIAHFDEIVAVYNQCTDATPDILARLAAEFGPKLRVYHYLPEVFPPGSDGHAKEPADSPASFVNMSNFALAQTHCRIAVKLDDDHLAIERRVAGLVKQIRNAGNPLDRFVSFSGLNVARDEAGHLGILAIEPFSGNGDIGFFEVTPRTSFIHRVRHEAFQRDGRRRVFSDFAYWHLKYLKAGLGFANRGEASQNERFARKRQHVMRNRRVVSVAALRNLTPLTGWLTGSLPMPEKWRLIRDRGEQLKATVGLESEFAELRARLEDGVPIGAGSLSGTGGRKTTAHASCGG